MHWIVTPERETVRHTVVPLCVGRIRADEGVIQVKDLVDTTEMYLRTIYDLEEEGVVPLRARIAERLEQSGPTVSQTVARMERDGLLLVAGDRHLELTDKGRSMAVAVMRKHRLAERLLVDIIGLDWQNVHAEACRWEHVMSEDVERRLVEVLNHPTTSPTATPSLASTNWASFRPQAPRRPWCDCRICRTGRCTQS